MQRWYSEVDMIKSRDKSHSAESMTDNDSGIGLDHDYSGSELGRSSRLIDPIPNLSSSVSAPRRADASISRQPNSAAFIRFPSDGIVERVRPVTMKNSVNSDFILCRTGRGSYIAYRTPIVPRWVTELVREIELREK